MEINVPALFAGVAASVVICAHGIVGHRWMMAQLSSVELQPTKLFGDADVALRVFGVVWHIVTAVFLTSAVTLYLVAFGVVESRGLLRFISVVHAVFLGVGLVYLIPRPDAIFRPIPPVFVACMVGVSVLAWLASN